MRKNLIILSLLAVPAFAGIYNGTVVGTPTFGSAKFSNGLTAVSDANYITLPASATTFGSSASWTVEMWVTASSTGPLVAAGESGGTPLWLGTDGAGNFGVSVAGFSGGAIVSSGIPINNGSQHHVALVMTSGTSFTLWVDGVQGGGSHSGTWGTPTPASLYIGRLGAGTGFAWDGKIDELAIWDSAKYTSGFTPPSSAYAGTETNLRALYHLESDGTDSGGAAPTMAFAASSPTKVGAGSAGTTLTINGTSTAWTSGTTFSATAGTITAQSVNAGTQVATLTYTAPSSGPVTFSQDSDAATASLPIATGTYAGTTYGSPTFSTAKFSNGLTSVSDVNYINLPASATTFGSGASWTIEMWLTTTSSGTLVALSGLKPSIPVWLGVSGGDFAVNVPGFGSTITSGIAINDGAQHHCALVMSGGISFTLWVDGVQGGSSHSGTWGTPTPALATLGNLGHDFLWDGKIDELAIWDTSRYTGTFTPPSSAYTGTESNLRALYHLQSDGSDATGAGGMVLAPTGVIASSTGNTITVTGSGTSWLSGTVFSATGGTITAQSVNAGTQVATLTYDAPSSGPVTFSEDADLLTADLTINTVAVIAPDDSHIIYSPFNWVVTSGSARTVNAGAYFRTIFIGTQFKVTTDTSANSSPYPELWVRIDNQAWVQFTLSAGNPTLSLATGVDDRKHLIEVVVKSTSITQARWSSPVAVVAITSILVDPGTSLYSPVRRTKNILIYGDSITEGVLTVNLTAPNDTDQDDILGAYSWGLTQLDAEVGIVGFGGQGVNAAGVGSVPALTSAYNFIYSGASRSFSSPAPNLIIYNLGTNDGSSITSGLTTVANAILAAAPAARQVILVPFNGTHASDIAAAVSAVGNALVTSQSTTGWWTPDGNDPDVTHPLNYAGAGLIAPRLLAAVIPILYPGGGGSTATVGVVY